MDCFLDIDEIIRKWTLEEIPIPNNYLNDIREVYGNRKTGILYRGMSIDRIDQLEQLEQYVSGENENYNFQYPVSSTPCKDTAQSFMHYTKSYDPMTMASGMRQLSETGCKGRYATVLLKFEVLDKKQVIFKTYHDKGEENLPLPESSAEDEAFIYGDVKIIDLVIQYPLTKENYKENILNVINEFSDLDNPPYRIWCNDNLSNKEKNELNILLIKKIEKNYKNKKRFIKDLIIQMYDNKENGLLNYDEYLFDLYPEIEEYISKKVKLLKPNGYPFIGVKINNKYYSIEKDFGKINLSVKYFQQLKNDIKKEIELYSNNSRIKISESSELRSRNNKYKTLNEFSLRYDKNHKYDNNKFIFTKLLHYAKADIEMLSLLLNKDYYKENNKIIKKYIEDEILIEEKIFDKQIIFKFEDFLNTISEIKEFLITEKTLSSELFQYFYTYIPTGNLDSEKKEFLFKFNKITGLYMKSLMEVNGYANDFENTLNDLALLKKENNISPKII